MNRALVLLSWLVLFIGFNFWPLGSMPGLFFDFSFLCGLYYKCTALAFVLLSIVFIRYSTGKTDKIGFDVSVGFFTLCMNSLLDELIFDPLKFGLNEYVLTVVVIAWILYKSFKNDALEG